MIEVVYLIVVIAFATACVLTLFNHLIRANQIREAIAENSVKLEQANEQMTGFQAELQELRADSKLLDDKHAALKAQGNCMARLLEAYEAEREAK